MSTDNGQPDDTGQDNGEPDEVDTGTGQDNGEPDSTDDDSWTPPDKAAWEKLQEKAKTRDQKLREAQAKIKKLENPDSKPDEPDPVSVANLRIIRAEARTALAAAGVTDRATQVGVLDVLNLSGVEVDDRGEVDSDALEEVIEKLRKAFGGTKDTKRRVPALDTRDRGGPNTDPADADAARRRRFLTGR